MSAFSSCCGRRGSEAVSFAGSGGTSWRFLDSVAELVDCAPKLTDYLDGPPLLYKLICGSSIAATYRLRGLGADREMAREVILRLPVVRDAVDPALVPLALAGRVEESAIPKIREIVEQQLAADTQLA